MMGKYKQLKIFICIAIVLFVGNIALYFSGQTEQTQVAEDAFVVTDISVADFAGTIIQNNQMNLGILQNGSELELITEDTGTFDISQLRTLIYSLCHMTASLEFADESQWEGFGMAEPTTYISLFLVDGSTQEYALLNQNPIDGSYYLYSETDNKVFMVGQVVGDMLSGGYSNFYAKTIFPTINGSNYTYLEGVFVEYADGTSYELVQKDGGFYMTSPISQKVSLTNVVTGWLPYVGALYADEVVATNADLSDYGLDQYDLRITMTVAGEEYIGCLLKEDGSILFGDEITGSVYRVAEAEYTTIAQDYTSFFQGKAFQYAMGDIAKIDVSSGTGSTTFDITPQEQTVVVTIGGEIIPEEDVITLFQAINGIAIERVATEQVEFTNELNFTFQYLNGMQDKVVIGKTAAGEYCVSMNDIVNFMVTEDSVTTLQQGLMGYMS
ncbi:DUF4340 domain-containing protein [Chakrabartyella piscis]|uniref:DUF4340 domain-containing protein n=1 Tax=Chakrabartyella piscis TaxID=2918914 RepID=UPI0029583ECB|nr:DUF4340 domain-containing protein [Chakrabartyella piscis]